MKRHWILLFLVPFFLGTSSSSSSIKVKFHNGSLTSAKTQAAQEGKLYIVEFMADWCKPCIWMDENTFTDTELADYIHQNYVAVKVNIDDFDGYAHMQLQDVQLLPSFLIFNSQGELLAKYGEPLSQARLLSILKKYNVPANRGIVADASSTGAQQSINGTPINETIISEPEIPIVNYDITASSTSPADARPPGRPGVKEDPVVEAAIPENYEAPTAGIEEEELEESTKPEIEYYAPGTGLFRFSVARQHNNGYSLQLGVFAAYENVLLEAAKLEDDFKEYPVIVHIAAVDGKRVYRVMLGEFPQKRDAIQFKRQLERYGINGVVKKLATL